MACQLFEFRNVAVSNIEFCYLACVQQKYCEATIYDKTSAVWMLMNDPCFSLKSRFNHVYRSFRYECTKWMPHAESHRASWYIEEHHSRSYMSRKSHEGDVIIGKKATNFFATDPMAAVGSRVGVLASAGATLQRDLGATWFNRRSTITKRSLDWCYTDQNKHTFVCGEAKYFQDADWWFLQSTER